MKKKKTKAEMNAENLEFLAAQQKYNETGDMAHLWAVEKIMKDCIRSSILKQNRHSIPAERIEEMAETALLRILNRYHKNSNYNYGTLQTLCYWDAKKIVLENVNLYKRENFSVDFDEVENYYHEDNFDCLDELEDDELSTIRIDGKAYTNKEIREIINKNK